MTADVFDPVETPPAGRRSIGTVAVGALLLVSGLLWLVDVLDIVDVRFGVVLPVMLAVVGLVIVFGSFQAPQVGLIFFGLFLAIATLVAAVTPSDAFHGGIGQRDYVVTEQVALQERYDVGLGGIRLDLSNLTMIEPADVVVSVGAGDIEVIVPPGVPLLIEASVGAGEVTLFGQTTGGISVDREHLDSDFESAPVTLKLRLSAAAGNIEVRR